MDDESEYDRDLTIDDQELDAEWLDQSSRMFKYCRLQAEANRELNLARESLSIRKAQLDREVRSDPSSHGIDKVTEATIAAAVLAHEDYSAANRKVIDAQYNYELVQGAVRAFDHRKSALENLVRLHGQSYFAGPHVPHDLHEIREKRDRDAQTKIRMRRRT